VKTDYAVRTFPHCYRAMHYCA